MKVKVKVDCPGFTKSDILESTNVGYVYSHCGNYFQYNLYPDIFEEIKEPLFVTDDGKELFDKEDKVFGVCPKGSWQINYYSGDGIPIWIILESKSQSWKYFSTKEASEKWIDENKPIFSKKQIMEALDNNIASIYDKNECKKELGL